MEQWNHRNQLNVPAHIADCLNKKKHSTYLEAMYLGTHENQLFQDSDDGDDQWVVFPSLKHSKSKSQWCLTLRNLIIKCH